MIVETTAEQVKPGRNLGETWAKPDSPVAAIN